MLIIVVAGIFIIFVQCIVYVNVNIILESIDEYQVVQCDFDKIVQVWWQEIVQEYDKIKGMYNCYQVEQVFLSEDEWQCCEEEIMEKEQEVCDL